MSDVADAELLALGVGSVVVDGVLRISRGLQARGWSISMAETIDATRAAATIGVADRDLLRASLRATLTKRADDAGDLDDLFDRVFPLRAAARSEVGTADVSSLDALGAAVAGDGDLAAVATALVDRHAGLDEQVRGERHHVQRVLRAAELAKLMGLALRGDIEAAPADVRARIEELKRLIAAEVRARLGAPDDELFVDVTDVEFLRASRAELAAMRSQIQPLARRIATRLARRRQRARSGRADLRRTTRRSLSSGGVPLEVIERRRRPQQTELFVLCDISGSIAEFSLFMLTLVAALSAELPRTRSFVFVDAVDEITALLHRTGHAIEPWQILRNTDVIGDSGHSDYGAVFEQFWERYGRTDLTSRSVVLVVGDARCNLRPARSEILGDIARRARAVYWMNPEPRADWNEHDSEMDAYEAHCRRVFEVRDLHQLAGAIERIV